MIYTPLTKKALKVCFEAHKDQTDKTGMPYVFHPFHLAEQMTDELTTVCALLHDVVEDSPITLDELAKMGFPPPVIEVLELLTHKEDMPYEEYVKALAKNPIAKKVKIEDLKHNSDMTRMDENEIDERAILRAQKYARALAYLIKS